jgi:hypothetical protein
MIRLWSGRQESKFFSSLPLSGVCILTFNGKPTANWRLMSSRTWLRAVDVYEEHAASILPGDRTSETSATNYQDTRYYILEDSNYQSLPPWWPQISQLRTRPKHHTSKLVKWMEIITSSHKQNPQDSELYAKQTSRLQRPCFRRRWRWWRKEQTNIKHLAAWNWQTFYNRFWQAFKIPHWYNYQATILISDEAIFCVPLHNLTL